MKKLATLLCLVVQVVCAGDSRDQAFAKECATQAIRFLYAQLGELAVDNGDLTKFLLMRQRLDQTPAQIAADKKEYLDDLVSRYNAGILSLQSFERLTQDFLMTIPKIVQHNGQKYIAYPKVMHHDEQQYIAYQFTPPDGRVMSIKLELNTK